MGSCGLIRVMLVLSPLAALLATMGLEDLVRGWSSRATSIALLFLIGNALYTPWRYYHYKYPLEISSEQVESRRAYTWLSSADYEHRPWAYLYPYLSILAQQDPWDPTQHIQLWGTSLPYMPKGTLVIWDGHFGPNECGISKEALMNDPDFKLLQHIQPEQAFQTLNDHPFEILIFEKLVAEK